MACLKGTHGFIRSFPTRFRTGQWDPAQVCIMTIFIYASAVLMVDFVGQNEETQEDANIQETELSVELYIYILKYTLYTYIYIYISYIIYIYIMCSIGVTHKNYFLILQLSLSLPYIDVLDCVS